MTVIDDTSPNETPTVIPPVNLDDVHASTMQTLDNEVKPEVDENGEPIPADSAEDTTKPDDTAPVVDEGDKPEDTVEKPAPVEPPKPVAPEPTPELNTDTTKNAAGKIAVKDSDGTTHYFNNLDEVPDDFEPATYKEWGKAVQDFADKRQSDRAADNERKIADNAKAQQAEIDQVTEDWQKDIASMTKSGALPADEKTRETEVGDVYAYISKQLSKGKIIDSFEEAHKAMKYEEWQAKEKVKAEKLKKDKGSVVMSGSGGSSGKPKAIDPLPAGIGLDAVHARYSGLV